MPSSLVHSAKPDFRVIGTFRRRLCVVSASSVGRPEPDWRSFRAHLVRSSQDQVENMGLESNLRLLSIQSPTLAAEGVWAHATPVPEPGGLLLATRLTPSVLGSMEYWQVVVLLLQHTAHGSMGLVLNRPTTARVGRGRDGLPAPVHGLRDGLPSSRLYWGGAFAEHAMTLLHAGDQAPLALGSREIAPGIHCLFGQEQVAAAASDMAQGCAPLRFFAGASVWGPGQLEQQVEQGAWTCAAASRSLVLKPCIQLPVPLWRELACMLGDERAARRAQRAPPQAPGSPAP
ncbi:hypothetical protein ABPG77_005736 [Micractinium sp. CCAP 211/92]